MRASLKQLREWLGMKPTPVILMQQLPRVLDHVERLEALLKRISKQGCWVHARTGMIDPPMQLTDYRKCDWKCVFCGIGTTDMRVNKAEHAPDCSYRLAKEILK